MYLEIFLLLFQLLEIDIFLSNFSKNHDVHLISQLTDKPIRVSSLIFLAPPLSLVFIATVLGEPVATSTLAGLLLILAGLVGQQVLNRPK